MSLNTETDAAAIPNETARDRRGFHQVLKQATHQRHVEVDSLFSQFDLADRTGYANFLAAHAAALLPVEDWLDLPSLGVAAAPRTRALQADMAALGQSLPVSQPLTWTRSDGARWGAAYVVEGSRLGGAMLLRSLPAHWPSAYLAAVHQPGAWRVLLAAIDNYALRGGSSWQQDALTSAERTFSLYRDSAIAMGATLGQ